MDYPTNESTRELQMHNKDVDLVSQAELTEEFVVPVLREELEVHKEIRKTGTVRIRKTVHELEELVNESLASETVTVERVPVNLIVDSPPSIRTEGEVTIVPVMKEELIIKKQLRVVEELRITKRISTSDYREPIIVRAEEVTVERIKPETSDTNTETSKEQA